MNSMRVHPQARALLDRAHRHGATPFHELSVAEMRRESQKLHFGFRPDAPPIAEVREVVMTAGSARPPVRARLYRPFAAAPEGMLPLLIYFHGGGWTVGDLDSYDVLCRELAVGAGCAVLSVEYRLAPEHPFPAAVEDADLAVRWSVRHARQLGIDCARVAVGGDSAGGNLAAVAAIMARDRGHPDLRLQLLVYPATDQSMQRDSHRRFAQGHLLTIDAIRRFQCGYLRNEADFHDWRAAPLLAPDLSRLAPAYIIAAENDPLVDDGLAYAERLRDAGVEVTYSCYSGMIHSFFTLGKLMDDANRAVAEAVAALVHAFARPPEG